MFHLSNTSIHGVKFHYLGNKDTDVGAWIPNGHLNAANIGMRSVKVEQTADGMLTWVTDNHNSWFVLKTNKGDWYYTGFLPATIKPNLLWTSFTMFIADHSMELSVVA